MLLPACTSDAGFGQPLPVPIGFPNSVGVERVQAFGHPSGAAHLGVDAVTVPRLDPVYGEMRNDQLLVAAAGTGVYAALVDDSWNKLADAFWPVPGYTLPWSDIKVVQIVDAQGQRRRIVYHVSRGSNLLQITDVTAFPQVTTVQVPVDVGHSSFVRGVHTLQVHEGRGVMVLNGIDIGADPVATPLTAGCAPAAFYDIATDPMAPRLLSVFCGEHPGDQVMFDSQFLHVEGRDIWAPTIFQPTSQHSYFAFYDFSDPTRMTNPTKLAEYQQVMSGQAHNVVQLPPRANGHPLLAAGFEAWAFLSQPTDIISKAAVLDATGLSTGTPPQFVQYLASPENLLHAVHNPASRLEQTRSHTFDTVPLAHFTGGYFLYQWTQGSANVLAHVPLSRVAPSGRLGYRHALMSVPTWMAGYNGSWDCVATPIGDFISCTDREASYLIEPTYGFVRQFGTYIAQPDGTAPRVSIASSAPQVGHELRIEVTGLEPGGRVGLAIGRKLARVPTVTPPMGLVWIDQSTMLTTLYADATSDRVEFVLPQLQDVGGQLAMMAVEFGPTMTPALIKSPVAIVHVMP